MTTYPSSVVVTEWHPCTWVAAYPGAIKTPPVEIPVLVWCDTGELAVARLSKDGHRWYCGHQWLQGVHFWSALPCPPITLPAREPRERKPDCEHSSQSHYLIKGRDFGCDDCDDEREENARRIRELGPVA
ncbi:hypothetical protein LCGC14_0798650 [marine sediment metagenome]|uniref:Uncharacterized protein n=1 Tax=marine sediment metagenome TaxID=412755 RepID=A0A0F9QA63_9ZZZZ